MPTTVLAAGTTPADSTEITVAAGAPVTVGAFRDDEQHLDQQFRGVIYRKDPDGNFNDTQHSINRDKPNQVITGPGIYIVRRSGDFVKPTGIQTD